MFSLSLGTFLMALDSTIISVATPKISTDFHALDDVGWYMAAYGMTLCAFTPVLSSFYKHFDPKIVYLAVIFVFEVGSALCAAAPTSASFITGRAIAGLGAGGLLQGAFGLLTYVCDLKTRPLFMAIIVSLFGLMSGIGPLIGGAFTDDVTWRWCFWINLPIGGSVFFLVLFFMKLVGVDPTPRQIPLREKLRSFDVLGIILLLGSVICLFLALQIGGTQDPWSSSKPIGLLVGFGLLAIAFGLWQWKAGDQATIPLRFFNDRTVVWGSLYLFWDNMANYIAIYYMPYYFQAGQGVSPIRSAVEYISLAVPLMVCLLLGGGITTATGHYMPVILVAQVLAAVGTGLLTTININTTTAQWATYMALTGAGLGMGVNVPHIAIQAVFENDNDIFIANGIASFFGQLGGSMGVPIANAILLDALHTEVPKYVSNISADAVMDAGASGVNTLSSSPSVIHALRSAWAVSVAKVNILLVVVICISVPTALGMRWLNLKKISDQRELEKRE
ncbi:MFS multidrug transporter-like protein, partial [Aspergillus heteromorphus CBS 117.55]